MLYFFSLIGLLIGSMSAPRVYVGETRNPQAFKPAVNTQSVENLNSMAITSKDTTLTLTFKMNYSVENPSGAEAPYDGWDGCNVRISEDGGTNWTVLTNPVPAYNCASLYSFGSEHWEGPNVAGWGGTSGGWIDVSFDITAYQGKNVKIRWAMASDPAYCTADDATLIGMQIDDINIAGVVTNNGDDTTGFWSGSMVQPAGDYWTLTDSSSHSTSHAYHCPNVKKLLNALASPPITLPNTTPIPFSFWVYCDMPDWDGDANQYLDDYYYVAVSTDSTISWDNTDSAAGADYAYRGADTAWTMRDSLLLSGVLVGLNLDKFQGQTIRLEFIVRTDNDDNGGVGTGVYIDDVQIGTGGSIFSEDFESGATGWGTKDLTSSGVAATWHPDTFNASGGSGYSWWSGDPALHGYSNTWYQVLDSPALTLPGVEENANPKLDKFVIKNLPNPFTLKTAISIQGVNKGNLSIYDLGGRLVRTFAITSSSQSSNTTIIWDGNDATSKPVPAGMYIYKVTSDNFSATKKMVLVR